MFSMFDLNSSPDIDASRQNKTQRYPMSNIHSIYYLPSYKYQHLRCWYDEMTHLDTLGVNILDDLPLVVGQDAGVAQVGERGEPFLNLVIKIKITTNSTEIEHSIPSHRCI